MGHVACPYGITRVVFVTLFRFSRCICNLVIGFKCAIFRGTYVTMARFIVLVGGWLFILFVFLISGLLNTRWIRRFSFFIYLLRRTFRLEYLSNIITNGDSNVCFCLFFLVSISVSWCLVFVNEVVSLNSDSFDVLGSLVIRVTFAWGFHAICRIQDSLAALCRTRFNLRIFAFQLFRAIVTCVKGA